jgi:Arc/MetJ-type ribon-helix-helix transcriptional regulator
MGETLVRFDGAQELIIEKLTSLGIFKTRSEAIRAGVIRLGKEYNVFSDVQKLEDELAFRKAKQVSDEIDAGKRKVWTEKQVKKKYGFK